jgi:D-serine deaminase-like pyridoxal phosphate-dependent protein
MDEATMIDQTANNAPVATLGELDTPCLILDADRMDRNIARLRGRLDGFDVSLRPHLKTAKSIEVARRVMTSPAGPATVSTLKEATQFAAAGTAHNATNLTGVTEVRAGVFVFFDLVMAGVGICRTEDIAVSVLATVIGHQREKGWILIDAGWMAMSQDRGTSRQAVDQGYGVVCDMVGDPYDDLIVADANQEHGIVTVRPGSNGVLPDLAIGDRVRILPNHACSTGAQHRSYHVVQGASEAVEAEWPRFGGW